MLGSAHDNTNSFEDGVEPSLVIAVRGLIAYCCTYLDLHRIVSMTSSENHIATLFHLYGKPARSMDLDASLSRLKRVVSSALPSLHSIQHHRHSVFFAALECLMTLCSLQTSMFMYLVQRDSWNRMDASSQAETDPDSVFHPMSVLNFHVHRQVPVLSSSSSLGLFCLLLAFSRPNRTLDLTCKSILTWMDSQSALQSSNHLILLLDLIILYSGAKSSSYSHQLVAVSSPHLLAFIHELIQPPLHFHSCPCISTLTSTTAVFPLCNLVSKSLSSSHQNLFRISTPQLAVRIRSRFFRFSSSNANSSSSTSSMHPLLAHYDASAFEFPSDDNDEDDVDLNAAPTNPHMLSLFSKSNNFKSSSPSSMVKVLITMITTILNLSSTLWRLILLLLKISLTAMMMKLMETIILIRVHPHHPRRESSLMFSACRKSVAKLLLSQTHRIGLDLF
jgi:hypothetical protein